MPGWRGRWPKTEQPAPTPCCTAKLRNCETAPYVRTCHAQEDHFVPLFTALGAAENDTAAMVDHDANLFGGVTASSYKID